MNGITAWALARRDVQTVFAKTDAGVEFLIDGAKLTVLETIFSSLKSIEREPKREAVG